MTALLYLLQKLPREPLQARTSLRELGNSNPAWESDNEATPGRTPGRNSAVKVGFQTLGLPCGAWCPYIWEPSCCRLLCWPQPLWSRSVLCQVKQTWEHSLLCSVHP